MNTRRLGVAIVLALLAVPSARAETIVVSGDLRATLIPKVYAYRLADGALVNLASSAGDWDPQLSPDGAMLAYVSARDGYPALYVAHADGSNPRRLTPKLTCATRLWSPQWSPDGTRIVFEYSTALFCARSLAARSYTVHEVHPLVVVGLDGTLQAYPVNGWLPRWAPDSLALAYVEENAQSVTGGMGTTTGVLDLATGAHAPLGAGTTPAWSPDGSKLALGDRIYARGGRLLRRLHGSGAAWTSCGMVTSRVGDVVVSRDRRRAAYRSSAGILVRRCGGGTSLAFRGTAVPLAFSPSGARLVARRRCRATGCPLLFIDGRRHTDIGVRADPGSVPVWSSNERSMAFAEPGGSIAAVDRLGGITGYVDTGAARTTVAGWLGDEIVVGVEALPEQHSMAELSPTSRALTLGDAPALSPDGTQLAFTKGGSIWVRSGGSDRLLAEIQATALAWSPDGRSLAYGSADGVGVVTLDGGRRQIVFARGGVFGTVAWTPDSASIAYTRLPVASEGPTVWLVSVDGRDNRPFLPHAANAVWSRDGARLAYIADGGNELVVADADGSHPRTVANGVQQAIAWSAHDRSVLALRSVVTSFGLPRNRLVAVAADGSGEQDLTDGTTYVAGFTAGG